MPSDLLPTIIPHLAWRMPGETGPGHIVSHQPIGLSA